MSCLRPLLVAAFLLVMVGKGFAALDVGQPLWGFDGTVQRSAFTVLSVEVANRGGQAFEGNIVLRDKSGAAPFVQRVFIAPGGSRWLQFFPYVGTYVGDWTLEWDDDRSREVDAGRPKFGVPAAVLFADPEAPALRSVKMRIFPDSLFPVTVCGAGGLAAAVLDHQPRWDAVRREAFLDWLNRGGVVHLVKGADGAVPRFEEALAVLNVPPGRDRVRVGAGLVVAHDIGRGEVSDAWLRDRGFPLPEYREDGNANLHDMDGFAFRKLAGITRPNTNWSLIYLLTIAYIIIIGPVFLFLRRRNYRLLLAGFIATVALFAWIFTVIGRRGYGEKQICHSLAIAHSLGGGRFDVQEWIHAFATTGDVYRFEHPGTGHLYATATDGDTVRGEVVGGREAHFSADIPLFSSRPFLHRGVMTANDPALRIAAWEGGEGDGVAKPLKQLTKFRVEASPEFASRVFAALMENQGRYYELSKNGDGFDRNGSQFGVSADEYFQKHHFYDHSFGGDVAQVISNLKGLHPLLISRVNGDRHYFRSYLREPAAPPDRARLFLFAEGPASFAVKSASFQTGRSFVLYVVDLFKP